MHPPVPLRKLTPRELGARPAAVTRHPVCAVVANVRSLHNVGAMFRTADAAGLEALHLCGFTPTPAHDGLHKTALGAELTVPWTHTADPLDALAALRARGYTVAVLEQTTRPTPVASLTAAHFPLAFVVGNEVDGVDDAVVAAADFALEVEQYGAKHSLNVSVAFGVAAYDLVRRAREVGAGR